MFICQHCNYNEIQIVMDNGYLLYYFYTSLFCVSRTHCNIKFVKCVNLMVLSLNFNFPI